MNGNDVGRPQRPRCLGRAPVPARLQQQYAAVGILRQPRGERRPGGAGADDDDIVHGQAHFFATFQNRGIAEGISPVTDLR